MGNSLTSSQRRAKRQRQIEWLRERDLLRVLPNAYDPPTDEQKRVLRMVVADMLHAGLYSRSTDAKSLRWGVRRLVSEARGEGVRTMTRSLS